MIFLCGIWNLLFWIKFSHCLLLSIAVSRVDVERLQKIHTRRCLNRFVAGWTVILQVAIADHLAPLVLLFMKLLVPR